MRQHFSFKIWETLSDEDIKMPTDGPLSFTDKVKGRIENIAETYASLYDEIVQGYEKAVKTVESIVQQQPKFQKAYEEYRKKLEKIGAGRAELANAYSGQSNSHETIPEGIADRMIAAKNEWKSAYDISPKNIAWQEMLSAISSIFSKVNE